MARTRENASEFGEAASAGKLVRDALRFAIQSASDSRLVSHLTQKMREIISLDEDNDRGGRQVLKENVASLLDFNFNAGAGVSQALFFGYGVAKAGRDVTLNIASINPQTELAAPQGATHYEVTYGAASVNFETKTYSVATVAAPLGIQSLSGNAVATQNVVATLPADPAATDVILGVLGVNFYQELNGKMYPLNNNSSNPLAVVFVG